MNILLLNNVRILVCKQKNYFLIFLFLPCLLIVILIYLLSHPFSLNIIMVLWIFFSLFIFDAQVVSSLASQAHQADLCLLDISFEYFGAEFSRLTLCFLCLYLESTMSPRNLVFFWRDIVFRNQDFGTRCPYYYWDVISSRLFWWTAGIYIFKNIMRFI